MDAINKNHWRSLKKFVADALKKAESHHINEDEQIRLRITLGLMNATEERQKEYDYSLFEGDGMNETFSIAVNQIFEGYTAPPDDYSVAHTRFKEERPYVCGLAWILAKKDLDTREIKVCSTCCIAHPPLCLLSSCRLSVMFFGVVLMRQLKNYRAICRCFTNKLMILPELLMKRVMAN